VCSVVTSCHSRPAFVGHGAVVFACRCYGPGLSSIGLKIFSATKARDRESLGETITDWIRKHPDYEIFDKIVTQSSDSAYHCLAITVFYRVIPSKPGGPSTA